VGPLVAQHKVFVVAKPPLLLGLMGEDPFHNRLPGRVASGKIGLVDAAPADIHATRGDPNALVWQADDPFDILGIVAAAATQENDVAALNPTEPAPEPPD